MSSYNDKISGLLHKGVKIPNPTTVELGEDINIDNISANITIHSGCKLFGNDTVILSGSVLGYEAPVTIQNCQIGTNVQLKGGFFKESVFLDHSQMGSGAHVREGTILEEYASGAHTVGLKQTILFPFVTLGSLINFCDCLMAGGTGQKHHSEVGSSYIHFNFTPHQDKATASLIGDVPNGVMLNQAPIFLGGQGGLVGPSRIAFGTVIAAGTIYRKDILKPGKLVFEGAAPSGSISFSPGVYMTIKRIVNNNLIYIANLIALSQWYEHVRRLFIGDGFPESLYQGLIKRLHQGIDERIKRLKELSDKLPYSIENIDKSQQPTLNQQLEFYKNFEAIQQRIKYHQQYAGDISIRDTFLEQIRSGIANRGKNYIDVIKSLNSDVARSGSQWLQGIVDTIMEACSKIIPLFGISKQS